ncbi:MAG: SDR family oxidoreductase [Anaerolineae bacterium]|jgi:short-subunit dehydrogenase|nr:SDR family oxidoreductase [Anaerolineae bacterium]
MTTHVFRDKVVIISGASSGIGREIALQLAAQGAWPVLAARRVERLEAIAQACREHGSRTLVVPTDVSRREHCERLIFRTVEEYGRLDMLINNAGITMWSRFEDLYTLEPLEQIMQVNYFGAVYCTHYALPHLRRSRGRLVAVSSLSGKTGVPVRSGYAASKHAIVGFFDSLRIELAQSGVSVTLVYPDFVATETRQRAYGPDGSALGHSPVQEGAVMSAETCARLIIEAAARRERERILSLRGKIGQWIKLLAPGVIDRIAQRAIQRGR